MYVYSRTESFIRRFLKKHYINSPDQLSMESVANAMNLRVRFWEHTSESVSWKGNYRILLERKESQEEQWQEFGHELCHVLWHAGRQEHLTLPFVELQEWQADYFAHHFCVPTFMLAAMDLPRNKNEAIGIVRDAFRVDPEFAERRLDIWLQQREGFTFYQKLVKELS